MREALLSLAEGEGWGFLQEEVGGGGTEDTAAEDGDVEFGVG